MRFHDRCRLQRFSELACSVPSRSWRRSAPCVNASIILVEGGPQLMGDFFAEQHLDELFLTLAPQIAGRNDSSDRPGLLPGSGLRLSIPFGVRS